MIVTNHGNFAFAHSHAWRQASAVESSSVPSSHSTSPSSMDQKNMTRWYASIFLTISSKEKPIAHVPHRYQELNAYLSRATGISISQGDFSRSATDGNVIGLQYFQRCRLYYFAPKKHSWTFSRKRTNEDNSNVSSPSTLGCRRLKLTLFNSHILDIGFGPTGGIAAIQVCEWSRMLA